MNIVLAAFGKRGYFYAAYNLALTIKKHSPDAKILLIHDKGLRVLPPDEQAIFDIKFPVDESITHPKGVFDAGNVKLHVYRIAIKYFKEYMFLDVDAFAIKSLEPWYKLCKESEKDFLTDVRGKGGINDRINYSVWAANPDIWEEFGLKESDTYYAIQSSWHYAKKTRTNTAMFKDAMKLNLTTFEDRTKLLIKWGKSLPDELVLGGALARRKFDPSFSFEPIFFPNKHKPLNEVKEQYYIISMFGNGRGATMVKPDFKEFYDRFMLNEIYRPMGKNLKYKNSFIMQDKMLG